DHLAGLDVVETVDAGDAVTDRQHLADFRNLGFLAEILDLVFQDGGNFRGADIHQRASFIANLIELSLVRSDASTMREPTFTFSPPMIEGSTVTSTFTSLPVTCLSAARMSFMRASLSCSATVTCAVTSPRWAATSLLKPRIMSPTANRRRLLATTFRKFAAMPRRPALSSTAPSALACSSAAKAGERTRRARSGDDATSTSNAF